jgi:sec-independent protein translocase protein TatA
MLTGVLQPTHLIILLAIALIVLGPKRLPDAGRALGQSLREFKASVAGESPDESRLPAPMNDPETPPIK